MNGRLSRVLLAALFVLGLSVLISGNASAANFSAQNASSSTINASSLNYPINITITNIDLSANITRVNITLYGFTFRGANSTTANNSNFSNSSITQLGWVNYTNDGFIANGSNQSFGFNVNVTSTLGYYNITVNVTDTSGTYNVSNITYTVVLHNITFSNFTSTNNSTATNNNLTFLFKVNNSGGPANQTYGLSVVNCNNPSQAGIGTLNLTSVTLGSGESAVVMLNVTGNNSAWNYSSCINASLYSEGAYWNFTSSKDGVLLNSTFYSLDLNATALSYSNSSGGQYIFAGSNVTANATLLNTGTQNFTGSIIVSFFWDGAFVGNQTVANTSLPKGTANYTIFNITGGNVTNGLHNITVQVDSSNNVAESNETNNNYTNSSIFVGYNVTILSVTGYNGTTTGINATPSNNVTLNVSVKYGNGDPVSGLTANNFTVYDLYSDTAVQMLTTTSLLNFSNYAGYYLFNISAYSYPSGDTTPGIHNLTVNVSRNESGNLYSGGSTGNSFYYLVVPKLVVTVTPDYYSRDMLVSQTVHVTVTNAGNDIMYNVTITYVEDGTSYLTFGSTTCATASSTVNITVSTPYSCTISNVKGIDISGLVNLDVNIIATATGNYPYGGVVYTTTGQTGYITIHDTSVATTTTTGGGDTSRKCTSDASCTINETCSSAKKCVAISCPNGQIVNRTCIAAADKINITDYASSLSAVSGGTTSTKVTINNAGGTTFLAKLEVTINNVTATVSPASYGLEPGDSYQFTVNFTVPNSTTIGNFSGSYKAYVSTSTATYDRKSFTFVVLPKEETKAQINVSYQNLSAAFSLLISELNQMKASGRYNQSVLSSIDELINAANSTLLQMKGAIDSNDYVSAQSLISQVNTSINNAKTGVDNAQLAGVQTSLDQGMWFWIAIVVIIVFVLGFFLYMFYPSKGPGHEGYHPEKGFAHPEAVKKEGIGAKIKKKFKRKKKPPQTTTTDFARSMTASSDTGNYESFHYSEGYKKEKSYQYEYPGRGIKGLFQRLKRKSKKGPQMHIDQFATQSVA